MTFVSKIITIINRLEFVLLLFLLSCTNKTNINYDDNNNNNNKTTRPTCYLLLVLVLLFHEKLSA